MKKKMYLNILRTESSKKCLEWNSSMLKFINAVFDTYGNEIIFDSEYNYEIVISDNPLIYKPMIKKLRRINNDLFKVDVIDFEDDSIHENIYLMNTSEELSSIQSALYYYFKIYEI